MKHARNALMITVLFAMLMTVFLSGCAKSSNEIAPESLSLEAIVEKLCEGVEVPPYETVRLDQTNFEYFAFVPYDDSLSAVAADALVNITPHSVVVIRAENGNGEELAKGVVQNADPNKWLCVGSEAVNVAYTDHYIVLIMSDKETADAMTGNFKAAAKELDGMEMTLLTANNSRYEQ